MPQGASGEIGCHADWSNFKKRAKSALLSPRGTGKASPTRLFENTKSDPATRPWWSSREHGHQRGYEVYITLLVQNEDQHIYSAARRGFRRAQCLDHRAPRAQYAALGSRGPVPSGFGGLGESQINEHLDERFNEALDFVDDPV